MIDEVTMIEPSVNSIDQRNSGETVQKDIKSFDSQHLRVVELLQQYALARYAC